MLVWNDPRPLRFAGWVLQGDRMSAEAASPTLLNALDLFHKTFEAHGLAAARSDHCILDQVGLVSVLERDGADELRIRRLDVNGKRLVALSFVFHRLIIVGWMLVAILLLFVLLGQLLLKQLRVVQVSFDPAQVPDLGEAILHLVVLHHDWLQHFHWKPLNQNLCVRLDHLTLLCNLFHVLVDVQKLDMVNLIDPRQLVPLRVEVNLLELVELLHHLIVADVLTFKEQAFELGLARESELNAVVLQHVEFN